MWRRVKESLAELKRDRPGERFHARYRRQRRERERESYFATVGYIAAGVLMVALGIVFSFWPVIPGFVFVLAGLALLTPRSERLAHALDRIELAVRRLLPRRWQEGAKPPGK